MEKKKPKCKPCEMYKRIKEAKDGDMISVPEKCVDCDYHIYNFLDKNDLD